TVMAFVGDEVGEDVADVQRKVAPDVGRGRRNSSVPLEPELEEIGDARAASLQGPNELGARDAAAIDRGRHRDTMRLPEDLDPGAAGVMNVTNEHSNRPPWRTGDGFIPKLGWNPTDEEGGDSGIGRPGAENAFPEGSAAQPAPTGEDA